MTRFGRAVFGLDSSGVIVFGMVGHGGLGFGF